MTTIEHETRVPASFTERAVAPERRRGGADRRANTRLRPTRNHAGPHACRDSDARATCTPSRPARGSRGTDPDRRTADIEGGPARPPAPKPDPAARSGTESDRSATTAGEPAGPGARPKRPFEHHDDHARDTAPRAAETGQAAADEGLVLNGPSGLLPPRRRISGSVEHARAPAPAAARSPRRPGPLHADDRAKRDPSDRGARTARFGRA